MGEKVSTWQPFRQSLTHRAHQGVQHADGERCTAGERLGQIQLRIWVIVIVLVQKLNVGVVHCSKETGALKSYR